MREIINQKGKLIVIDKPIDWTSMDTVAKVRSILKCKKAGHGGTLDPLATGVLIVATNELTKELNYHLNEIKGYRVGIQLGISTDSYDIFGKITNQCDHQLTNLDLIKSFFDQHLNQDFLQKPPIFSAIKIRGQKSYELARKNIEVNLSPRKVHLFKYQIYSFNQQTGFLKVYIEVSKGFYVRSFVNDLGVFLKTGATVNELIRTHSGHISLSNAMCINDVHHLLNCYFLHSDLDELKGIDSLPLILGNFDGIHHGHEKLFKDLLPQSFDILTFKNIPHKSFRKLYSF